MYVLLLVVRDGTMLEHIVMRSTLLDQTILYDRASRMGARILIMASAVGPEAHTAAPALLRYMLEGSGRDKDGSVVQTDLFWNYVATIPRAQFAAAYHMGRKAMRRMFLPPERRTTTEAWAT